MPKTPEIITSVGQIPWEGPQRSGISRRANVKEKVSVRPTKIIELVNLAGRGSKVRDWLPGELARQKKVDAIVTRLHLTDPEGLPKWLYRLYRKENFDFDKINQYFGPNVEAILIIYKRLALKKVGEPMVLSNLDREFSLKAERRTLIAFVVALDELDATKISPAVGGMDIPHIAHEIFKKTVNPGLEIMVFNAGRRKLRLSEPMK